MAQVKTEEYKIVVVVILGHSNVSQPQRMYCILRVGFHARVRGKFSSY